MGSLRCRAEVVRSIPATAEALHAQAQAFLLSCVLAFDYPTLRKQVSYSRARCSRARPVQSSRTPDVFRELNVMALAWVLGPVTVRGQSLAHGDPVALGVAPGQGASMCDRGQRPHLAGGADFPGSSKCDAFRAFSSIEQPKSRTLAQLEDPGIRDLDTPNPTLKSSSHSPRLPPRTHHHHTSSKRTHPARPQPARSTSSRRRIRPRRVCLDRVGRPWWWWR